MFANQNSFRRLSSFEMSSSSYSSINSLFRLSSICFQLLTPPKFIKRPSSWGEGSCWDGSPDDLLPVSGPDVRVPEWLFPSQGRWIGPPDFKNECKVPCPRGKETWIFGADATCKVFSWPSRTCHPQPLLSLLSSLTLVLMRGIRKKEKDPVYD